MSGPRPPLDLTEFRERSANIVRARHAAIQEFERHGLAASEAEHDYRRGKAVSFAKHRSQEKSVTESEIMAEGEVAGYRKLRDDAMVQRKAAELRIAELERNASMLRIDLDTSQRIDAA